MNYYNSLDNITEIYRNKIIFKERYRVQHNRHAFHNIPKVMIRYLTFEVFRKLNYFPIKGFLSSYYSTWTIKDQQPLDYNKHCKIIFGALKQENNNENPKNSNVSRTIGIIYLWSSDIIQGGHEIFDLHIHRVITRQKIIEIAIIKAIIKHTEDMDAFDKVTPIKFNNRVRVIYGNDWIAEVEFENVN